MIRQAPERCADFARAKDASVPGSRPFLANGNDPKVGDGALSDLPVPERDTPISGAAAREGVEQKAPLAAIDRDADLQGMWRGLFPEPGSQRSG